MIKKNQTKVTEKSVWVSLLLLLFLLPFYPQLKGTDHGGREAMATGTQKSCSLGLHHSQETERQTLMLTSLSHVYAIQDARPRDGANHSLVGSTHLNEPHQENSP